MNLFSTLEIGDVLMWKGKPPYCLHKGGYYQIIDFGERDGKKVFFVLDDKGVKKSYGETNFSQRWEITNEK